MYLWASDIEQLGQVLKYESGFGQTFHCTLSPPPGWSLQYPNGRRSLCCPSSFQRKKDWWKAIYSSLCLETEHSLCNVFHLLHSPGCKALATSVFDSYKHGSTHHFYTEAIHFKMRFEKLEKWKLLCFHSACIVGTMYQRPVISGCSEQRQLKSNGEMQLFEQDTHKPRR